MSLPSLMPSILKQKKGSRSAPVAMLDGNSPDAKYTIKGGKFSVGSIAKVISWPRPLPLFPLETADLNDSLAESFFFLPVLPQTLASAFIGITVFGSPISSAVAKGLGGFPLMMADGSKAGAPRLESRYSTHKKLRTHTSTHRRTHLHTDVHMSTHTPQIAVCRHDRGGGGAIAGHLLKRG